MSMNDDDDFTFHSLFFNVVALGDKVVPFTKLDQLIHCTEGMFFFLIRTLPP